MATKTAEKKSTKGKASKATKAAETEGTSKKEEAEARRQERSENNSKLTAQILEMREDETPWAQIAETLEISQGKAMFLYMVATVDEADRITGKNDDDLAKKIVKARDNEQLSWGLIAARTGYGEAKCRSLYEQASGNSALGNRIGKGGRYPGDEKPEGADDEKPAKKASTTKKAAADANPSRKHISDMNQDELNTRLSGQKITVSRNGGKAQTIGVKSVKKLAKGVATIVDAKTGNTRDINVDDIKKITR